MRRVLLGTFVLLIIHSTTGWCQEAATLRGFVTDAEDGQPLIGAHVVLIAVDSTLFGTIADVDGFYTIANVPAGAYTLKATFVGYQPHDSPISLEPSQIARRDIELELSDETFEEVLIQSERVATGAGQLTAGLQSVKPIDIERIPLPGVSADLASYLTQLPGVVSTGDRGGLLFIRGGSPTENGIFLDGLLLYQPFHILGFYSAFPSELVGRADVYAGGFGPEFGGRISSIIDVSSRTGGKKRLSGSASVSSFMASGRLEGPIVPGKVSFLGSFRRSLVEEIGSEFVDEPLPYQFGDAFGKIHANLSPSVQASITGISTHDRGFLVPPETVDTVSGARTGEISWSNQAAGARFLVLPSTMPILAEIVLSYSRFENSFETERDPTRNSQVRRAGGNVNFSYFVRDADIRFGLSVFTLRLANILGGQFQDVEDSEEFLSEGSAYLDAEFRAIPGMQLTGGVRIQSFPSVGHTSIEPRAKAIWQLGSHRLTAAAGFFTQEVVGLNDRRDAGDVFTAWVPTEPTGEAPSASHLIGGYQFRANQTFSFSLEGYYKDLSNLVVPEWTAFPRFTTNLQPADGRVAGIDVRTEVDASVFYGFVGYGYSRVEYEAGQQTIPLWFGEETLTYHPPHDRRHQVTANGSVKLFGFDLSALWQFGSGTPFTQALGFDEYIMMSDTYEFVDVREESGQERVIYGSPYEARMPDYHRLDLSISRMFRPSRHIDITAKFDLMNVYDRENVFFLDLFTLARVNQLPRFPAFGVRIDFR
jgi:hypothetical protein